MKKHEKYVRGDYNNVGEINKIRSLRKTNIAQKRSLIFMLVAFFITRIDNMAERLDTKMKIEFGLDYPGEEIIDFFWIDMWYLDFIGFPLLIIAIILWIRSLKKSGEIIDEKGNIISED